MKKVFLALLAVGTLSSIAPPAFADNVNIQEQNQTAITTGDRNINTLDHEQTIRDRRRNDNSDSGNIQYGSQVSDTLGSDNDTYQRGAQRIDESTHNRPSSRR